MGSALDTIEAGPCDSLEYLTRDHGWQPVMGQVPVAAITRPGSHDWGRWRQRRGRTLRYRECNTCHKRVRVLMAAVEGGR